MGTLEGHDDKYASSAARPQDPNSDGRTLSERDAKELAAFRAEQARMLARYTGWKPLTVWYALWAVLFALAAMAGVDRGNVAACLGAGVLAGICALYTQYLYRGGTRRVWFVIF